MSDLLRWPLVGRFARHTRARLVLQLPLLAIAIVLVAHGLFGPPNRAPKRGDGPDLGALSRPARDCAPRDREPLLHRLPHDPRPRCGSSCRSSCMALASRAPHEVAGYRALRGDSFRLRTVRPLESAACHRMARAGILRRRSPGGRAVHGRQLFCKYICPIGQFNFISATLSPTELRVRDIGTCRSCHTVDCIKGRLRRRNVHRPGCGGEEARGRPAGLRAQSVPAGQGRQPRLHPVPRLRARLSARQHRADHPRSRRRAAGEWTPVGHRPIDPPPGVFAVLCVLFVFGAMVNAFAMTAPAHVAEAWIAAALGTRSETGVLAEVLAIALIGLPVATLSFSKRGLAGMAGTLDSERVRTGRTAIRLCPRAARAGGLDGALPLSPAHRCDDPRSRRSERGHRLHRPSPARRTRCRTLTGMHPGSST